METSVQEALKIGLVNNQIHTLVISGGTGVGKSYILRQCLEAWHIPYRLIPIYVENSQLQETIDFEASLEQGKMIMSAGLLDDTSTRCWVVDDGHVLAPEVRHALLVEAKRRQILLIMTINHGDRTLDDAEWELVDVHVSMAAPTLESRIAVLQQNREEIQCGEASIAGDMLSLIATKRVQNIAVSDAMLSLAISYALQARTVGHGAEYVLLQVMKSLAVLDGNSYCKPIHADRAALYVLPHRMNRDEASESQSSQGDNGSSANNQNQLQKSAETIEDSDVENSSNSNTRDSNGDESNPNESDNSNNDISGTEDGASNQDVFGNANQEETSDTNDANPTKFDSSDSRNTDGDLSNGLSSVSLPDTVARIANQMFHWKLQSYKTVDRQYRKGSGRRLMTKTKDTRGRMIRAYQDEHALEDLALVDTLRAAAPYQRLRAAVKVEQEIQSTQSLPLEQQEAKGLSIVIKPQDYRRKAREKRIGAYQLFVVDASGSMAARHRMEATKSAILSLLRDSYIHRDSVGLIAFRKESAEVLLPFTRSVERAEQLLASMPTGGKTPLAHGLRMAYTMCDRLLRVHRSERIQIICITDGRATSGDLEDPVAEAKQWARILGTLPVDCIVIDTETGFIKLGLAKELCKLMNGSYYAMDTITADDILRVSRR
ncbi:MAG: VWA domain-containing protein [Veillonella sp.]|uniref:VWA domain-containing protein n=1 Tax=Veillonella sp. TaxID=1926307 RepID=UPI002911DF40|nr:VWA domain-containing protein [Veillonella sp.]MDU3706006.1 VWA domain-containing protein [Veillonella sp.]